VILIASRISVLNCCQRVLRSSLTVFNPFNSLIREGSLEGRALAADVESVLVHGCGIDPRHCSGHDDTSGPLDVHVKELKTILLVVSPETRP